MSVFLPATGYNERKEKKQNVSTHALSSHDAYRHQSEKNGPERHPTPEFTGAELRRAKADRLLATPGYRQ